MTNTIAIERHDLIELSARVANLARWHEDFDGHDPYGSCMDLWFGIADELYHRGADVPAEWEFTPSPFGIDTDNANRAYITNWSDDLLRLVGGYANQLYITLDKLGLTY